MRIVFFGTPAFAVPSLEALLAERAVVVGVVTQPDKPQGRSRSVLVPPPVKRVAEAHGLPILQPDRPRGDVFLAALRHWQPEIGVVVAYGHLLRAEVLSLPSRGMINVHASLLPELRGAAPINWAILRGYADTGVSIMQMDEGLDSGPILRQTATPIGATETAGELASRLAALGAETLVETVALLQMGTMQSDASGPGPSQFRPENRARSGAGGLGRAGRSGQPPDSRLRSGAGGLVHLDRRFGEALRPGASCGRRTTRTGCDDGTVDRGHRQRAGRNCGGPPSRTGAHVLRGVVPGTWSGPRRIVRVKPLPRVFGVTTDAICRAADFTARIGEFRDDAGGIGILVRAPGSTAAEQARYLATAVDRVPASMIFAHGRPDLAALAGAAGLQLRGSDLSPKDARTVFPGGLIGVSVHDRIEAETAIDEGADYLVAGMVFESASHPGRPGSGLEWLEFIAKLGPPVLAIGGMTLERIPEVREAGAWGIAAISAVWDQPDPAQAARSLHAAWTRDHEIGLTVNGEARTLRAPATLAALLEQLELDARAVVVELNRKVVRRPALADTALRDGDAVELVHFVGGG